MIKPSEFQILMLALSFWPLIIWAYRFVGTGEKRFVVAALAAVTGAYVATVAEGFVAEEALNTVEHFMYAAAGVLFAVAAVRLVTTLPHRSRAMKP